MPTEVVIIEFQTDTSQLQPAEDRLTNFGKIDQKSAAIFKATNDQLKQRVDLTGKLTLSVTKEQSVVNKLVASLKSLSGESKKAVESLLKLSTDEISKGFNKAATNVDDYISSLKAAEQATTKTDKSTVSLRTQLRSMIEALTAMKVAGRDNTEQYKKMSIEAGHLKDSLADVTQEVTRLGSDTSTFDGLISAAQGLAGGFAVAQGAAALFGDESEEVQEVLLRVNAAMAILQGLQQIQNVLQKESAASLLVTNIQRKVQNAQIAIENGLQSRSIVVRAGATAAQWALNAAMAANPIGLVVTALAGLIAILAIYVFRTDEATDSMQRMNREFDDSIEKSERYGKEIIRRGQLSVAEAELAGKSAQQIREIRTKTLKEELAAVDELRNEQEKAFNDAMDSKRKQAKDGKVLSDEELEAREAIIEKFNSLDNKRFDLIHEISLKEIEDKKATQEEIAQFDEEAGAKREEAAKKAAEKARENRLSALNEELADLERQRLILEKAEQATIQVDKKIIDQKAKIELEAEGIKENKKKLIRETAENEKRKLDIENAKKSSTEALAQQVSRNNAELAQLNISAKDKLDLTIDNIIITAQEEANANEGNSAKIKEINAKRDLDIKAARLASIESTLSHELALEKANNGAIIRELQKRSSDDSLGLDQRIDAINKLADIELDGVKKRVDAINEEFSKKLISLKDYNLKYAELTDEQKKIVEDAEEAKRKATKKTAEEQKAADQQRLDQVFQIAQQVSGLINSVFDFESDVENQKIAGQRAKIQELKEAGAISEKEAIKRLKAIDIEEKKVRIEQARRDKAAAIFAAVINAAQAVVKAYATVGPIAGPVMAAIIGGLSLIQIGLIANRPIPKFGKGKEKGIFEGYGQVGETGDELIESRGRMYVAKKPTILWLGKSDKVYNPAETSKILNRAIPGVHNLSESHSHTPGFSIDYERLGREVGKHTSTTLSIDGYKEFIKEQQSFTTYLNHRRGY